MFNRLGNLRYLLRPLWIAAILMLGAVLFVTVTLVLSNLNWVPFNVAALGPSTSNGVTSPPLQMGSGWYGWGYSRFGAEDTVLVCGDGMKNSFVILPNNNVLGVNNGNDPNTIENPDVLAPDNPAFCQRPIVRYQGARGWPLLAVRYQCDIEFFRNVTVAQTPLEADFYLEGIWSTIPGPVVPLVPMWPGFAINLLFYTLIAFLLLRGFVLARGVVRLRDNRCVLCGYQLREHFDDGCSECGWRRPIAPPTVPQQ